MDRSRLREILVEALDKLIGRPPRILGLTNEQWAALLAVRQTVLTDDPTLDKILPNVGPYHTEGGDS